MLETKHGSKLSEIIFARLKRGSPVKHVLDGWVISSDLIFFFFRFIKMTLPLLYSKGRIVVPNRHGRTTAEIRAKIVKLVYKLSKHQNSIHIQ